MALATKIPMGPSTASASRTPHTTGFSPVAAQSAPPLSMAAVAAALVPRAWALPLGYGGGESHRHGEQLAAVCVI